MTGIIKIKLRKFMISKIKSGNIVFVFTNILLSGFTLIFKQNIILLTLGL